MKILFFCMILFTFSGHCFAQPNNPYNQRGNDFTNSLNIITADFRAGKVKEFNEATVRQYSRSVPLQNQASLDLVNTILKTMKAPGFSINATIDNGSASSFTKQALKDLFNPKNLSTDDYKRSLVIRVDEINKTSLPAAEKEFLLSVTAIAYNNTFYTSRNPSASCYVTDQNGVTSNTSCSLACAVIGATIGFYICGPWCALGGAIIGAVAGSLS